MKWISPNVFENSVKKVYLSSNIQTLEKSIYRYYKNILLEFLQNIFVFLTQATKLRFFLTFTC